MSFIIKNHNHFLPTFSKVFNHLFDGDLPGKDGQLPAVNIKEQPGDYQIEVAAPGLNKEDFKIALDKNVLTISAEKEVESTEGSEDAKNSEKSKTKYTRREFNYQTLSRSFTLPKGIKQNEISATYTNGVLNVTVPKEEEKVAKDIKIL